MRYLEVKVLKQADRVHFAPYVSHLSRTPPSVLQVRATLRDQEDELAAVSTDEQREEAIALANEQEDWLYDEGWSEDAKTYRKKRWS